jgi:hypothetical protein
MKTQFDKDQTVRAIFEWKRNGYLSKIYLGPGSSIEDQALVEKFVSRLVKPSIWKWLKWLLPHWQ